MVESNWTMAKLKRVAYDEKEKDEKEKGKKNGGCTKEKREKEEPKGEKISREMKI